MKFPPLPVLPETLAADAARYKAVCSMLRSEELYRTAFSTIDLTTLNPTDTVSHVAAFTQKVNSFVRDYPGIAPVAAICVYPNMASVVREHLAVEGVQIAAVAGGFPSSMTFPVLKAEEARQAVIDGAGEIDIVLPLWAFLEENYDYCLREIRTIRQAIGEAHLKVILESGILGDPEKIWRASLLSLEAGADFIKTSTGKMAVSATPEAAIIMCHALKYWEASHGEKKGFKPAGGISTAAEALVYMTIVEDILGCDWLNNRLFRIGASRLANDLLEKITGHSTVYF